jgi:preprotein translocase subunit SecD
VAGSGQFMKIFATALILSLASLLGAKNDEGAFIQFQMELAESEKNDLQVAEQVANRMTLFLRREGISDFFLQAKPPGEVTLVLPRIKAQKPAQIAELLTSKTLFQPVLNFHRVHPENHKLAEQVAEGTADLPEGYSLSAEPVRDSEGQRLGKKTRPMLIEKEPVITGDKIKKAWPDVSRSRVINVTLTDEGGEEMKAYTANITPGRDRMAHVLNGRILSAPGFQTKNLGKKFVITGAGENFADPEFLASAFNPLPPLKISTKAIRMISAENLAASE